MPSPWFLPDHFVRVHGTQQIKNDGRFKSGPTQILKEKSMRKNAIRLLVAAVLLVSGSLMQIHAAINPLPVLPLPPVQSN
jgi:hypothetical protein